MRKRLAAVMAEAYELSAGWAGETAHVAVDGNNELFVTSNANDMRAVRWVLTVTASPDPDGVVRMVGTDAWRDAAGTF